MVQTAAGLGASFDPARQDWLQRLGSIGATTPSSAAAPADKSEAFTLPVSEVAESASVGRQPGLGGKLDQFASVLKSVLLQLQSVTTDKTTAKTELGSVQSQNSTDFDFTLDDFDDAAETVFQQPQQKTADQSAQASSGADLSALRLHQPPEGIQSPVTPATLTAKLMRAIQSYASGNMVTRTDSTQSLNV
ncbi:hypothetical protein MCP1_140087 [Candidatus Terasakiella magnetica]|nr:hypothetical protein MCP1_140087 [Candidatus Terasakiella magnetica]